MPFFKNYFNFKKSRYFYTGGDLLGDWRRYYAFIKFRERFKIKSFKLQQKKKIKTRFFIVEKKVKKKTFREIVSSLKQEILYKLSGKPHIKVVRYWFKRDNFFLNQNDLKQDLRRQRAHLYYLLNYPI